MPAGETPPCCLIDTSGATATASTPFRSSVASDSGPGRRSGGRRPPASISTSSPGASTGRFGPLTSRPPPTVASVSASDSRRTSMVTADPGTDTASRTVPRMATDPQPRWPSIRPGLGRSIAVAPRSDPTNMARSTSPSRVSRPRPTSAAEASNTPAPRSSAPTATGGTNTLAPAPAPHANPPQIAVAHRPEREPARRFTAPAARRGCTSRGRRRWRSRLPDHCGAGSST